MSGTPPGTPPGGNAGGGAGAESPQQSPGSKPAFTAAAALEEGAPPGVSAAARRLFSDFAACDAL
jgi:hypothetical protein